MNEWDGFCIKPFKDAALSVLQRITSSVRGVGTGGFPQPTPNQPPAASLGDGLFQDR